MRYRCLIVAALGYLLTGCSSGRKPDQSQDPNVTPEGVRIGPEMNYFESAGVRIAYADAGHGDPVVLLHGFTGNVESWRRSSLREELLDAGYRVLEMDCRGHGRSEKPHDPDAYGVQMADDVTRLLDHLGIARAHLVGYSMGGDIANKVRERHPSRLLSATIGGAGRHPNEGWVDEADFDILVLADSLEKGEGLNPILKAMFPALSSGEVEKMNKGVMAGQDAFALSAVIRSYARLEVPDTNLRKNSVPTLVVVGEKDPVKPNAERLQSSLWSQCIA